MLENATSRPNLVSAYRFCRTDDMPLLVEAYNRCWLPHFPEGTPLTLADFKQSVRELQVWCSSSMVAFDGDTPIGFLFGAKRETETLVHRIAVHPDHLRKEHGRHLLTSLSSKLAILGPARIVAEIPAHLGAALGLFESSGYTREAELTDYIRSPEGRAPGASGLPPDDSFLVPVAVDDLTANDLLEAREILAWERRAQTLTARKDSLRGFALATLDSIAAFLLYRPIEGGGADIAALRSLDEDDAETALGCLVDAVTRRARGPLHFRGVHAEEVPSAWLEAWGFVKTGSSLRYAVAAKTA